MQTRRLICLDQVLLFTATILATLFGVALLPCYAQQEKATTSTSGEDVESQPALKKALKYHKVLTKRPNPGYLFDRFYDAWLEASSSEALGDYLKSQVETTKATNDRLLLAFFHAKLGDDVAALQQFQAALKNDPGNAATLYEKAVVEARTLNFETALKDLEAATKANPSEDDAAKIAQLRGKLLVRSQQTKQAIAVWNELLQQTPNNVGLLEDTIETLITEGLYDEAAKWSDKLIAISKDPFQKVIRQLRKGDIFQRSGKRKKALEIYGGTLSKVGVGSWLEKEILGQIDNLFRREDNLIGLSEHLAGMIKQDDKRLAIRKAASRVLFELGETDKAVAALQKIVDLTPGDRSNRESLISLLVRADEVTKAAKQMEALANQYPTDPELQIRLAELFHKGKQADQARAALEKSIELSDNSEYSFLRAARLFEKFADKPSATSTYEKTIAAFPESVSAKESWATFLLRSDRKDEAIKIWKTLAKGADRAGLVRIARIVSGRKLHQAAMDILLSRYDDLKLDSIYLGQLCVEAIALKKFEQAVPWATQRIRLAKTAGEVEVALNPSIEIIASAKQSEQVIETLKSKAARNAAETCLLTELLERALLGEQADATLQQSIAAVKDQTDQAEAWRMLARQKVRLLVGRQDWSSAAAAAQQLLEMPGGRKSVNVRRLVELHVRSGEDKSALKWIAEWKRLSPGSILPWLQESSLLERIGDYKESINVMRSATRAFPDESDLFAQLARKYLNNGQHVDAQRIYWRQYDDAENLSDKLRWAEQLANVASNYGQMSELLEKLKERKKNNPKSIGVLLSIAQAHRVADNYEERRAALLEATQLQKDSVPLLFEIARMEESEGDWEQAITTLERASLIDKTNKAKQKIARIYIEYGEAKEGLARLLDIAGGANSSARDIEKIAVAIVDTSDWEQLRDFVGPHVERFPKDYRLGFLQAIANEELGFHEEARQQLYKLLNANEEILGNNQNNNAQQTYITRQYAQLAEIMPKAALEFMQQIAATPAVAYGYRQDQNQYGGGYYGVGGGLAYLPNSLDSCRSFAIAHLREMALKDSDTDNKTLRTELIRAGVGDVDLLLSDLDQSSFQQGAQEILDVMPGNQNALAIATLTSASSNEIDSDTLIKSYESFKQSYPALSFMAAMQLDLSDTENQKRFEAAIKEIKQIKKPGMTLVSIVIRSLTMSANDGDSNKDSAGSKYRKELNGLIADWYSQMPSGQYSGWMFNSVVNTLREDKSPKNLIELFDRELAKTQATKKPGANVFFGRYQQQSNGIQIALPQFPPPQLLSFPSEIYQQLSMHVKNDEDNRFFNGGNFANGDFVDLTKQQVTEAIDIAQDPMLKALLQLKLAGMNAPPNKEPNTDTKDAKNNKETICQALLKSDRKNVDAWYLAASLATSQQRWEDASALFETMRSLPMNAQFRRKIDGHLIALATQGLIENFEKTENQKVVGSAKSAALRLQRGRLSTEERVKFVPTLEALGLKKEAEKLESKIAANPGGSGGNPFASSGGRVVTATPKSRIESLVDAGKTDAASRLLAQEFRSLVQPTLNFNTYFQNEYEIDRFADKLKELGLRKELINHFEPGESTSKRKLLTHAMANELLSNEKKSIKYYKSLLETHPKEDVARLRLLLLQAKHEKVNFEEHFSKVNPRNHSSFLQAMLGSFSRGQQHSGQEFIDLATSVMDWLDSTDTKLKDVSWLSTLQGIAKERLPLQRDEYEYRTPSMHWYVKPAKTANTKPKSKRYPGRRKQELLSQLAKDQRILHDRIALKMIDFPQVAAEGFTAFLGSQEAAGKPIGEDTLQLALKAVYPPKRSPSSSFNVFPSHSYFYSNGDEEGEEVTLRTPVEFLSRHFGLGKSDQSEQIEQIAGKLESLKAKEDAAMLRRLYTLCKATPETFVEVSSSEIDQAKTDSRRPDETKWFAATNDVVTIWEERGLDVDIENLIVDFASRKQNNSRYGSRYGTEVITKYLNTKISQRDVTVAQEFLAKLRAKLLGSEANQEELLKLIADKASLGRNPRKLRPLAQYVLGITEMLQSREAFFVITNELRRFQIGGRVTNFKDQLDRHLSSFTATEQKEFIAWLQSGKLLGNVSNFDALLQNDPNDTRSSAWAAALSELHYRLNDELRKSISKTLKGKKSRSFGESVFLFSLNSARNRSTKNVYDALGPYIKEIKSAERDKQIQLANFLSTVDSKQRRSPKNINTKDGKQLKSLCRGLLVNNIDADLKKLMAAKTIKDLGINEHEFGEWALELLPYVDKTDTDKAKAAISKVVTLIKGSRSVSSYSSDNSISSTFVSAAIPEINKDSLNLLLAIYQDEQFTDFSISKELSDLLQTFLKAEYQKQFAKNKRKRAPITTSMDGLKNQLGSMIGEQSAAPLIIEFHKFFKTLPFKDQRWFNKCFARKKTSQYPNLYRMMRLAWLTRRETIHPSIKRSDKMSALQTEAIAIASDSNTPMQARLPVAIALSIGDERLPVTGVWACCDVISEALDNKISINRVPIELFEAILKLKTKEGFVESGGKLAKKWTQASVANRRSGYRSSPNKSTYHIIKILAKTDNLPEVKKLLAGMRSTTPDLLATLVESGLASDARSRSKNLWRQSGVVSAVTKYKLEYNNYSKELDQSIPEYAKLFEDEGEQFLAEVLLKAFRDPDKNRQKALHDPSTGVFKAGFKPRKERLAELCPRFKETKFKSKRYQQLAAALLSQEFEAASQLRDELAELCKDADVGDVINEVSGTDLTRKLMEAHYSVEVQQANFAPLKKMFQTVNGLKSDNSPKKYNPFEDSWKVKRFVSNVTRLATPPFITLINEGSLETLEEARLTLAEFNVPSIEYSVCAEANALVHLALDKADQLPGTSDSNTSQLGDLSKFGDTSTSHSFLQLISNMATKRGIKEPGQRVKLVTDTWRVIKQSQLYVASKNFQNGIQRLSKNNRNYGIERIVELKLLTDEQILEVGPTLAEINSVNGEIWRQVATRQLAADQIEQACESFRKALEQSKANSNMKKANYNRQVEYANALVKKGDHEAAKKLLKKVQTGQLMNGNPKLYKQLKKTLNIK